MTHLVVVSEALVCFPQLLQFGQLGMEGVSPCPCFVLPSALVLGAPMMSLRVIH